MDDKKNKKALQTEELMHALTATRQIDEFLHSYKEEFINVDLQTYLYQLLKRENLTIPQVIEKAGISRSLAYQIFNGQRLPNRNLLIRIAIIMKLSLDETQRLLRISRRSELYPRIQRDAAIIFCLQHRYSLIDTNELLEGIGEAILIKED